MAVIPSTSPRVHVFSGGGDDSYTLYLTNGLLVVWVEEIIVTPSTSLLVYLFSGGGDDSYTPYLTICVLVFIKLYFENEICLF